MFAHNRTIRATFVAAMLPLALWSGLPATSCCCANGNIRLFCRCCCTSEKSGGGSGAMERPCCRAVRQRACCQVDPDCCRHDRGSAPCRCTPIVRAMYLASSSLPLPELSTDVSLDIAVAPVLFLPTSSADFNWRLTPHCPPPDIVILHRALRI